MRRRKCSKCGTENPAGAAYCNECGSSLEETVNICPNCGEENSDKAKFCMSCGTKLTGIGIQESDHSTEHDDRGASTESSGLRTDQVSLQGEVIYGDPENENGSPETTRELGEGSALSENTEDAGKEGVLPAISKEPGCPPLTGTDVETAAYDTFHVEREQDVPDKETAKQKKPSKMGKKIIIGIGAAIVVIILILSFMFRSPAIETIKVSYDGDTVAGTRLDSSNEGIKVIGVDENGEEHEISGWSVEDAKTLEMDRSSTVTVAYKDLTADLTVDCSTSELTEINAFYSGDASEGVVLDSNNDGFTVTAFYKNGNEKIVDGWTIAEPQTLAADTTSRVVIRYEDKEYPLDVICTTATIDKITAKYSGSTKAGVEVGEGSDDVTVTAVYKNGEKQEVTGWTVEKPVTLKEGETSKLKIHYGDYDCTLKIECTDLSKKQYKSKCKSYTYNEIARDPDDYEGKKAKFSGEVLQALESSDSAQVDMRVAVDGDYDQVLYVVYYKPEGSSRILEGDHITVYGALAGVYTYTSTMNAQITIPIIYAEYVE